MFLINRKNVSESVFREYFDEAEVYLSTVEVTALHLYTKVPLYSYMVGVSLELTSLKDYIKIYSGVPYKLHDLPITEGQATYV